MKASDPLLRETLKGYLDTWGRLLGSAEIITTLQKIIDGEGGSWRVDIAGEIYRADEYVVHLLHTNHVLKRYTVVLHQIPRLSRCSHPKASSKQRRRENSTLTLIFWGSNQNPFDLSDSSRTLAVQTYLPSFS